MNDRAPGTSLRCPSCGGPLRPSGTVAVIVCSFYGGSALVPEGLRAAHTQWGTYLLDTFQANENGWLEGEQHSAYFTPLRQQIAAGRYRWEAQIARPTSMSTAWVDGVPAGDFELHAHAKHLSGSRTGSSWGLIFRVQDNQNYYWFRITDSQLFALSVVEGGQWHTLAGWSRSAAITPYAVNQLAALASGAHFALSINGQVVAEVDDARFARGWVGLAIEGYTARERTAFDFLDLRLRAP